MRRAVKITTRYLTPTKARQLAALLQAYRSAVNFYIRSLWSTPGRLDKATLARLTQTRLTERYKSQALKQALETVVYTRKASKVTGHACSRPVFKGSATLDGKFASVESGRKSFDLVVRLSSLTKGKRLTIVSRHTRVSRKWLVDGADWVQGCSLGDKGLTLWVNLPDAACRKAGSTLGVDIGVIKLLADSDGNFYGQDLPAIYSKIRRKKPNSHAKRRALRQRDAAINHAVNQLPWQKLQTIGCEDLCNVKKGKSKTRSKQFRKAIAPWVYRRVLNRLTAKAPENRVRLIRVPPANTSRTCPACRAVLKENRKGEHFKCLACGYAGDADTVGALNVLARTLETVRSLESRALSGRQ